MTKRKVILAITGASGQLYAREVLSLLEKNPDVENIAIIFSENGKQVWKYEQQSEIMGSAKIQFFNNSDLFAAPASGSAMFTDMFIVPCSMGTLGRISSGTADNLILRAADVMLKERRNLMLVVREAPYSSIHLHNMSDVSNAGAVIFPASPFFYHQPKTITDLINPLATRMLSVFKLSLPEIQWK